MTRLASIMGVATVATLVLLSGCESAVLGTTPPSMATTGTPWIRHLRDGQPTKRLRR